MCPIKAQEIIDLLVNPNYVSENADFDSLDCVSYDHSTKREMNSESSHEDFEIKTILNYCLPVYKKINSKTELNFWLNFKIKITVKNGKEASILLEDDGKGGCTLIMSDSSSLLANKTAEETEIFIHDLLKIDNQTYEKLLETSFIDSFKILHMQALSIEAAK
jgi:hypothetical protein